MSRWKKLLPLTFIGLLISSLLTSGCVLSSAPGFDQRVHSVTRPHEFSILEWELNTLIGEIWEFFAPPIEASIDDIETVREYLASDGGDKSLEDKAERILTKQIISVLVEEGILNPWDSFLHFEFIFPPLNFEFESPPNLLVISPRDEIRLLSRTTLVPNLPDAEKDAIEAQVDALDVSSLVVRLGGVGFTYPTMVIKSPDIRRTINRVIEEWFHQYMAFQPLGFLYLLDAVGVRSDYDIIVMNETVAGIVSEEIGAKVYQRYYSKEAQTVSEQEPVSDFHRKMRAIRIKVDEYLAKGEVAEAEKFMRESRDSLAEDGYHIRKLNQAYFAFHGTYADEPTSVSPIGQDLQRLREQCSSLRVFLDRVTGMTSYEDLRKAMEETEE